LSGIKRFPPPPPKKKKGKKAPGYKHCNNRMGGGGELACSPTSLREHAIKNSCCSIFNSRGMKSISQKSVELIFRTKISLHYSLLNVNAWRKGKLLQDFCSLFYHFLARQDNDSIFL